jgi:trehalose 6-phosphate phosphatase
MKTDNGASSLASQPPKTVDLKQTALLLDVDGTLLDIAATPDGVVVPPCLRSSLAALLRLCDGALALVSGRPISQLDEFFAPVQTPAVGSHGAEIRWSPDGPILQRVASPISASLRRALHQLAQTDPRLIIEDKGYSIALHWRLAPEKEAFVREQIAEAMQQFGDDNLDLLGGKCVLEIKSRQVNKGLAVTDLMAKPPFAGRRPFFLGDDITDESVFAVLPDFNGFGYSIGKPIKGARGVIPSPRDVRSWLASLSAQGDERPER